MVNLSQKLNKYVLFNLKEQKKAGKELFNSYQNRFRQKYCFTYFLTIPFSQTGNNFPRQSLKDLNFCVKSTDAIFFLLGLSPIVN